MIANDVISRVRIQLKDQVPAADQRWPDAELLLWVRDGCDQAVSLRPQAAPNTDRLTLVAGSRQEIPATWQTLLRLEGNWANNVRGAAIRRVDRYVRNSFNQDWPAGAESTKITSYWHDSQSHRVFHVYPPAAAGTQVEATGGLRQPAVADLNDTLVVLDDYRQALVDYVCYRAYEKDADVGDNRQLAAYYMSKFTAALEVKLTIDSALPMEVVRHDSRRAPRRVSA